MGYKQTIHTTLFDLCIITYSFACVSNQNEWSHIGNQKGRSLDDDTLPQMLSKMPKTTEKIELFDMGIKEIPIDVFKGFSKCDTLDLGINKISELKPGAFRGLDKLRSLILWSNQIQILVNNTFFGVNNIQYVSLESNEIHCIQTNAFVGLVKLRSLNLKWNCISFLSQNMLANLPRLHDLCVQQNRLTALHPSIFEFQQSSFQLRVEGNSLNCATLLSLESEGVLSEFQLVRQCKQKSGEHFMTHGPFGQNVFF